MKIRILKLSCLIAAILILNLSLPSLAEDTQIIIESFKKIVEENKKILENYPETTVEHDPGYRTEKITLKKISYDIKKTDSLISPYEGILSFTVLWDVGSMTVDQEMTVFYAYQDGSWIKKYYKDYNLYLGSGSTFTMDRIKRHINARGVPRFSLFPKLFFDLK